MCLYEQLAGETGTVQTFTRLADSYDHTGFILDSEGKPEEAEPYYQKGYEIFERLAAETGTIDARLRFSISCSRMADICSSKNDSIKAEEFYQKNIILLERQRELLFEGKRWYDLVRLARREKTNSRLVSYVLNKYEDNTNAIKIKLSAPDILYFPYSESELKVNPKLTQNPAYNTGENQEINQ